MHSDTRAWGVVEVGFEGIPPGDGFVARADEGLASCCERLVGDYTGTESA